MSEPSAAPGPAPISLIVNQERPHRVIDFPGERGVLPDGTRIAVGLWVLNDGEKRRAELEAIKYLEGLKLTDLVLIQTPGIGEAERKTQELFLALRDAKEPLRPFSPNVADLRRLTTEERDALCEQVKQYGEDRSAFQYFSSAEEVDRLISAVGKGLTTLSGLRRYDSGSLAYALTIAAGRLESLTRPSFLGSSSSSDSSPSSNPDPAGA